MDRRYLACCLLLCLGLSLACDDDAEPTQPPTDDEAPADDEPSAVHDYTDLRDLDIPIVDLFDTPGQTMELETDASDQFQSCHHYFEPDGEVVDAFPFDDEEAPRALFGCQPEGVIALDDGHQAIAYEVPLDEERRRSDLRIILFDADGHTLWNHRMERDDQAERFAAEYRGTALTSVNDQLICASTRWIESTQVLCARVDDAEITLERTLDFWAGLDLFGHDGALISMDQEGITRRYPFSGAEMRHRSVDRPLGTTGYYATDTRRLFVVPEDGDPILAAWDVDDLSKLWEAELAEFPSRRRPFADPDADRLLLRVGEHLLNLRASDGELQAVYRVGDVDPVIHATDDGLLLILLRRDDDPPIVVAVDTDDEIIWNAQAPLGTLDITSDDGEFLSRTVRTVRAFRPIQSLDR